MMPGLDGCEATVEIRRRRAAEHAVVAMTANAMQGDRERCLASGSDDHVSKPGTHDLLAEGLTRWLPEAAGR